MILPNDFLFLKMLLTKIRLKQQTTTKATTCTSTRYFCARDTIYKRPQGEKHIFKVVVNIRHINKRHYSIIRKKYEHTIRYHCWPEMATTIVDTGTGTTTSIDGMVLYDDDDDDDHNSPSRDE